MASGQGHASLYSTPADLILELIQAILPLDTAKIHGPPPEAGNCR